MTGADVIKEYLVSLGVQVDTPAYMKLKRALTDIDQTINKSAMGWTRAFGLAGTAIVGTLGAILVSTVAMMRKVSDSDIVFQKFGRQMLINESAAKSLKIATDAMGESLEDIAWNPELRSRFFSLVSDQRAMRTPAEAGDMRKSLRDITHEWTRMQVIAKYAMEWITYHLGKILGKDFKSLKDMLKSINDWLIKKMPEWTQKVAQFLAGVINIARSLIIVLKGIYDSLKAIWEALPAIGQAFVVFAGIVGAFFLSNPFGQALMMIGMLLLMLEDYVAFTEGRPSVEFLKPLWKSIQSIQREMKGLGENIKALSFGSFFKDIKAGQAAMDAFTVTMFILSKALQLIAISVKGLKELFSKEFINEVKAAYNELEPTKNTAQKYREKREKQKRQEEMNLKAYGTKNPTEEDYKNAVIRQKELRANSIMTEQSSAIDNSVTVIINNPNVNNLIPDANRAGTIIKDASKKPVSNTINTAQ